MLDILWRGRWEGIHL